MVGKCEVDLGNQERVLNENFNVYYHHLKVTKNRLALPPIIKLQVFIDPLQHVGDVGVYSWMLKMSTSFTP